VKSNWHHTASVNSASAIHSEVILWIKVGRD